MKKYLKNLNALIIVFMCIISLFGCTKIQDKKESDNSKVSTREVTDMSGRKVTIPAKVNKVVSLSNNTTVDLYTLAPDKVIGLSFALKPEAKKYINETFFNLPVIGTTSDKKLDYESIIKLKPDLIVCSDEDSVYAADDLQKQVNIPVVKVSVDIDSTDKVYEFLGECLGEQDRAKELADYSRKTLDNIKSLVKNIPEDKKIKVYYAEGTSWLQTDISGNVHTEVLDLIGGKNVADISETKVGSMADVSMEQVLSWNPDVILEGATAAKGDFYSKVYSDSNWSNINAVKNKKIYKIPSLPFNLFDRPPSAVRIFGAQWLANLLYPEYVNLDISKEMKNFYKIFYNYNLNDDEVQDLLKNATAR
ncbi:ABC transporter substrate-binding protein [Clostridium sp. BL-8]|uniref:ABC transporter substrate-binding protein n=1 Tax=Clostridium sp. BL-8 TaxID=349938 RepID=UPI0009D4723E|nr:ABC transporter substrate-binding protein [Clostridium sp. BL-8]OOM79530.1 Fe(3+)-citrate-binding protein YfmC precursor [Clostridium sp. BL-8]